ncbi:MAG: carbohydrate kinase family protein [Thermoplasmatales archaeon]|nr:carbohydrate kinase family protein [Thermoplasmatales archaeon]
MDDDVKTRLLEKLNQIDLKRLSDFHVVLLPDFFVDHFLTMDKFERTFTRIQDIYMQGGGNVPGILQRIHQGGNAANTALALARLGIKSHLICKTDDLGLHLLQFFLGKSGVDLSGVKTDGKLAITTAMEFGKQHVNVMVGDTGSVSDFTFEILDENDLQTVSNSDIVCVVNWTLNKKGTDLAKDVFRFAKKHTVKTFFDTGDPGHRKNEIPELTKNVLTDKSLDILGINENELLHYGDLTKAKNDEGIINAAVSLKKKLHARIDLHTTNFACTVNKNCTVMPSLQLSKIYRATGAGDTWNAGNLFAELLHFDDDERLLFANLVAGCYISSPDPIHPSLEKIISFINV